MLKPRREPQRVPGDGENWWCNQHGMLGDTSVYIEQASPGGLLFCRLCYSDQHWRVVDVVNASDPIMKFKSAVLKARMK